MQTIHRKQLYSLWQSGEVSLLMTESPDHYKCGHIPGSHYFSSSITKTLPILSSEDIAVTGKTPVAIVLYSRARPSLVTHWAYQLLREQHDNIFVYEEGLQDWLEAGYPISFADAITEASTSLTPETTHHNQHVLSSQQQKAEEVVTNTKAASSPPQPTPSRGPVLIPKGEQP
ncbi:MAG: rhodanese-like domain-containing protein [Deinococcota bacterium]